MSDFAIAQKGLIILLAIFFAGSLFSFISSRIKKAHFEFTRHFFWLVVYIPLFFCLYFGGIALALYFSLVIIQAGREIFTVESVKEARNLDPLISTIGIALGAILPFIALTHNPDLMMLVIVAGLVLFFLIPIFEKTYSRAMDKIFRGLMCIFLGVMLCYVIMLRAIPHGFGLAFMVVYLSETTSAMSYLMGRSFGRHKMKFLSRLSPKKTVEGFLAGIFFSALFGLLIKFMLPQFSTLEVFLAATLIGLVAQLGDLSFSIFKRDAGIKDYSHILMEEGGILDKFDSLILVAPVTYYFLYIILTFFR
jgi:phosphatidate cytidylyltransferase